MEIGNPNIFFPGDQFTLNCRFKQGLRSSLSYRRRDQVSESSSSFSSNSGGGGWGGCWGGGRGEMFDTMEDIEWFESEKPVYSHEVWKPIDKCEVKKGATFDVLSLLSKCCDSSNHLLRIINGQIQSDGVVQVDCLKGKLILLCCVLVPQLVDGEYASLLQALSLLSRELSVRSDVEIVLVIKGRAWWPDDYQTVARRFVSTFSCLVVPFDQLSRIDYICMSVNMEAEPTGMLVDPNQVVIQDTLDFVYGAAMDAFPFTDSNIRSYRSGIKEMKSLEQLLASNLPTFPYRICHGKREVVSVSELGQKLVGLYLYITGDDMSTIKNVYRKCQAQGLEFEVVVLCMPFQTSTTPESLEHAMASVLRERKLPWWVLPFNFTVFHRLHIRSHRDVSDRLFIVLPNGKLMEPRGELVTRNFGIDAYPFTRECVIKKAVDKVRRLTLESSLLGGFLYRGRDRVSVDHLRRRNVILCLDWVEGDKELYTLLRRNYRHLKAKDPDMEVVFACLDTRISHIGKWAISHMPWLVYVRDPSKSEFVADELFIWGLKQEKLVAFGKDGRISTLHAEDDLRGRGRTAAFPFHGDLVEEVCEEIDHIDCDCKLMHGMVWSDRSSI